MADSPDRPIVQDHPRLRRLERLGYLLDNAIRIPIIGYRIGWDALIGMLPAFGDVAMLLPSLYIIFEASRFHLPKVTLFRMVINVVVEVVLGLVPVLGDVFDATWKANIRNLDLLYAHLGIDPEKAHKADQRFSLGLMAAMLLIMIGLGALVYFLGRFLLDLLGG